MKKGATLLETPFVRVLQHPLALEQRYWKPLITLCNFQKLPIPSDEFRRVLPVPKTTLKKIRHKIAKVTFEKRYFDVVAADFFFSLTEKKQISKKKIDVFH
jgi:hypothetical protein